MYIDDNEQLPYDALKYAIGECNYGGRVTDDKDRRLLNTLLGRVYRPEIMTDEVFNLSASGEGGSSGTSLDGMGWDGMGWDGTRFSVRPDTALNWHLFVESRTPDMHSRLGVSPPVNISVFPRR